MTASSPECSEHSEDNDYSDAIAASKVANRNGRTMYHAFQRFCSDCVPHNTLDFNNHAARRAKNALQNAFNRLKRKAEQKGIIWLPTGPNAV